MKMNLNKCIKTVLFVPAVILGTGISLMAYADSDKNAQQNISMPPPGPYRSMDSIQNTQMMQRMPAPMNQMPMPGNIQGYTPPPWVANSQANRYPQPMMPRNAMQAPMAEMPEWMKKRQQEQQQHMQEHFARQQAEFEKMQKQNQAKTSTSKPVEAPEWYKKQQQVHEKHLKEMQEKQKQQTPESYAEWEKQQQAEMEKRQQAFKQYQAEARKRAEAFQKQQAEARKRAEEFRQQQQEKMQSQTPGQQPAVPEWVLKQQQEAQKQAAYFRAQQQKWMQQQGINQPPVWNAPRQQRMAPPQPAYPVMPAQPYRQMNPNMPPPWAYPQYRPAPRP